LPEFCRTCRQPIRWAYTRNGHAIPLDPEPVNGGNLRLDRLGRVVVVPTDKRHGPLYVSHFATCPHATQHRRRS